MSNVALPESTKRQMKELGANFRTWSKAQEGKPTVECCEIVHIETGYKYPIVQADTRVEAIVKAFDAAAEIGPPKTTTEILDTKNAEVAAAAARIAELEKQLASVASKESGTKKPKSSED